MGEALMRSVNRCFGVSALALLVLTAACTEPNSPVLGSPQVRFGKAPPTSGPTVTAALPSSAPQDITLDVQISGSGFVSGSNAQWLRGGLPDDRVRTNSTRFVSSSSLVANITISLDAVPTLYDIAVTTPAGKKGIGTEAFAVLSMQRLPAPDDISRANDVNSTGVIVGNRGGGCDSHVLPVIWEGDGSIADLPLPAGFCNGAALLINNAQVVVGLAGPTPYKVPVRWVPGPTGYAAEIMGSFPDTAVLEIHGLNDAGHVVGDLFEGSRSSPLWWSDATGFVTLKLAVGSTGCYATDIDEADEIVGSCYIGGIAAAVFWSSSEAVPIILPRMPGYDSHHSAQALNDYGVATGYGWTHGRANKIVRTAVRWVRNGSSWSVESIATLGGGNPIPSSINNAGWITGSDYATGTAMHAFLWRPGQGITDLGSIGLESYGWSINNPPAGSQTLIVGMTDVKSIFRAVVWRP
ncbi:MAG: hypothetical protein ABI681_08015 [Gemmatimonadales bacterium]